MSSRSPTLWVVATPIGNRGDLSERCRATLEAADVILAEDTRQAGLLCQGLGLQNKRFVSLFEHNEAARIEQAVSLLEQGQSLALISNAGSPVISDPGYQLVRACLQSGYTVSPIPGPSAPMAALMVSGLPPIPYTFLGFLPRKAGEKRRLLDSFGRLATTLIFFERKSRLSESLGLAHERLGPRQACLARELTKRYEELIHFRLGEWDRLPESFKGEFTILIGPEDKQARRTSDQEVQALLRQRLGQGDSAREAARRVQSETRGWSSKELYSLFLDLKQEQDTGDTEPESGGDSEA